MIIYSKLEINRIKDFWELLNRLDTETDYMMYEPNERKAKTTLQELKLDIQDNVIQGFDFLQIEWTEDNKIKSLKEYGCNLNNYNPYQHSENPQFRDEKISWF